MRLRSIAALAAACIPLLALPAGAQDIGTPGNAPLFPGGPRRGLGPPSITDSVPDIRLHSSGNGIPGAGPPIDYGAGRSPGLGRPQSLGGFGEGRDYAGRLGKRCQTPRRICVLVEAAPLETGCSCRMPNGGRARGHVTR